MPFPGYSAEAKAQPSCWNNTVALLAQHADIIDQIQPFGSLRRFDSMNASTTENKHVSCLRRKRDVERKSSRVWL